MKRWSLEVTRISSTYTNKKAWTESWWYVNRDGSTCELRKLRDKRAVNRRLCNIPHRRVRTWGRALYEHAHLD
jgi:hypothetical protein